MSLVYDIYTGKMVDPETHKSIEAEKAEKDKKEILARKAEERRANIQAHPENYSVQDIIDYTEDATERTVKKLNYHAHELYSMPTFVDECNCSIEWEIEWFEEFEVLIQKMYKDPDVNKEDPTIKKYRKLYDELKTTYGRINWKQIRFNDRMLEEAEAQTEALQKQAYYAEQSYKDQQYELRRHNEAMEAEARRAREEDRRMAEERRRAANLWAYGEAMGYNQNASPNEYARRFSNMF